MITSIAVQLTRRGAGYSWDVQRLGLVSWEIPMVLNLLSKWLEPQTNHGKRYKLGMHIQVSHVITIYSEPAVPALPSTQLDEINSTSGQPSSMVSEFSYIMNHYSLMS